MQCFLQRRHLQTQPLQRISRYFVAEGDDAQLSRHFGIQSVPHSAERGLNRLHGAGQLPGGKTGGIGFQHTLFISAVNQLGGVVRCKLHHQNIPDQTAELLEE